MMPSNHHELNQQQKDLQKTSGLFKSYDGNTIVKQLFTGHHMLVANEGQFIVSVADKTVHFVEYSSGESLDTIKFEATIVAMALSPDDKRLAISLDNGEMSVYSIKTKQKTRGFETQGATVTSIAFDATGSLLAMGYGDGVVKVFQYSRGGYQTHEFNNGHSGRVHFIQFHPNASKYPFLYTSAFDGTRMWNLKKSAGKLVSNEMTHTLLFWDHYFMTSNMKCYEVHRGREFGPHGFTDDILVGLVQGKEGEFLAISQGGTISRWDYDTRQCIGKEQLESRLTHAFYVPSHSHLVVASEATCNFYFLNLENLNVERFQLGFNHELLSVGLIEPSKKVEAATKEQLDEKYLVIGSTDPNLILMNTKTRNSKVLPGHDDAILNVAVAQKSKIVLTASKDHTVRAWKFANDTLEAFAEGSTHVEQVTGVAIEPRKESFFVTVSGDRVMKLYHTQPLIQASQKMANNMVPIREETSVVVHKKLINHVTIAPNGRFIATSSADKTAKIWNSQDLSPYMTLSHKKGVWCSSFSPVEKVLATGCSDFLIRLWSITSGVCLKIFEGHHSPVLSIAYVNNGLQLFTCSAQGIAKLWNIKTAECLATYQMHSSRIWSVIPFATDEVKAKRGEQLLTICEDGTINHWRENTAVVHQESAARLQRFQQSQQELKNLLRDNEHAKALQLAITLDQPKQCYSILKTLLFDQKESQDVIASLLHQLSYSEIMSLFEFVIDWNTNSRFSTLAQTMLKHMFQILDPSFISWNYEKSIDSLLSYSARHSKRIERQLEQTYELDFALHQMKLGGGHKRARPSDPSTEESISTMNPPSQKLKK